MDSSNESTGANSNKMKLCLESAGGGGGYVYTLVRKTHKQPFNKRLQELTLYMYYIYNTISGQCQFTIFTPVLKALAHVCTKPDRRNPRGLDDDL